MQDLQKAAVELMAAVERMSVEGVACLVAALPPILRLAELAPAQLQDALDSWLYSGRTLLLQVRMQQCSGARAGVHCCWAQSWLCCWRWR